MAAGKVMGNHGRLLAAGYLIRFFYLRLGAGYLTRCFYPKVDDRYAVLRLRFMSNKPNESVRILLVAERAEKIRQWAEMLRPMAACVWCDSGSIAEDQQADVVVADGTPVCEGDAGVIRIASDAAADVNLPDDTSAGSCS